MDERVREHAEVLVDWSARVEAGDDVVVSVAEDAHELGVAVAEALGERGANVTTLYGSSEVSRAYLKGVEAGTDGDVDADDFDDDPAVERAVFEAADAYLRIGGGRNTTASADVDRATRQAYAKARKGVREARMDTDWVSTVHPTRSLAQQAGMAYEEYQDFVYDAVLRDWESLAEEMAQMKDVLDDGDEVRIVTERDGAPDTDISMSIAGRTAVNSAASVAYDSHNLPSGEVFTAPYDTEGEVFFDVPMTIDATRVRNVHLAFEGGEVVDFAAEAGEDALADILDTDEGARRLGELGIGMNRGIDRFTDSILFDEKMGDTVHLAVGRAYDACLPEGESGNDSAVHVDMISDVSADSRMEVDGEVVQRNGTFQWEEGFEE
ncbi:peptidase M29 aminopeptidase II [Halorubrum distributum JCM 9100]|uniref:Peptidase M29 aminopeptidase II n=2 Tax=Halorubrum distributum TaxID=29283 RepID=M0EA70_9EURY|nr:aminopeptidase [Halorubrum distributum]ELZ44650.1 peptidase M29 aminopeptidase II [Halorubrum distributum JCM 9100]ELZ51662.1 peptidase M29 aminopeptidase II [Halorubrum distributum JCM 10118]